MKKGARFPGEPMLYKVVIQDIEETFLTDFVVAKDVADALECMIKIYRYADSVWEDLDIDDVVSIERVSEHVVMTDKAHDYFRGTDKSIKQK